jgi:hypothetical protein
LNDFLKACGQSKETERGPFTDSYKGAITARPVDGLATRRENEGKLSSTRTHSGKRGKLKKAGEKTEGSGLNGS